LHGLLKLYLANCINFVTLHIIIRDTHIKQLSEQSFCYFSKFLLSIIFCRYFDEMLRFEAIAHGLIIISSKKRQVKVFGVCSTVNRPLGSRSYQTNSAYRFLASSWMAIMAASQKPNRSVGLPIIAHRSRVYQRFRVPSSLCSQMLPCFDVVQSTDNHIKR